MRHVLEHYEISSRQAGLLVISDRAYPVDSTMDIAQRVAQQVRTCLWKQQAKRRLHLRGMENGRDEEAMDQLLAEYRSPKDIAMLGITQSDSVYTPEKAHIRWGYTGGCHLCGSAQEDWAHYIHDCPQTGSEPDAASMPDCLRY